MAELNMRDDGVIPHLEAAQPPASMSDVEVRPKRGLRISWLVILVILSVFLPMAILLSQQIQKAAEALSEKEFAQVSALAADFRVLYETTQEDLFRRLDVLAESEIDYASHSCNQRFQEMQKTTVELVNILFMDPEGKIICSAQPIAAGVDLSDREYFKRALTAVEPFGSQLILGRMTDLPLQVLVRPVRDETGSLLGVITAGMKLDWVTDKIIETKSIVGLEIPNMNVSLFDKSGKQTVTAPNPAAWSYALLDDLELGSSARTLHLVDTDAATRTYAVTVLDAVSGIFLAVSLPEAEQAARARLADSNSTRTILLAGFLILSLNLAIGHFVLVKPIQQLQKGANDITEEASSTIASRFAPREINDLRSAINQLASTLDRRTQRLSASNEELQQANADLSAFTYAASHDLKSPVNSVDMVLTELAQAKDISRAETRELVGGARSALSRMQNMIRDVLTFAQIVGDRADFYEATTADLNEVLFDVREDLAFDIRNSNADIRVAPLPVVIGNHTLLHVLFLNLVGNALKYAKPDCVPEIHVGKGNSNDPHFAVIEVRDNGIGIAPEFHEHIFKMFKRLHNHEEIEGTGIGLGICARIARGHSGHITISSTPGEGSTFRFHYPAHIEQV